MKSVGIKVLKNKLSEYIRLAAQGEIILICDRDNVVAELRPVDSSRAGDLADALLADLIRSGFVTPALLASGRPIDAPHVASMEEVLAGLAEDRDGR